MKRSLTSFVFLAVCSLSFTAQLFSQQPKPTGKQEPQSGAEVLNMMHRRYSNGPCKFYTFSQRNTHYRNDSVVRHSKWHEAVGYPDKFKIIFGDTADGNAVVFRNDSAYNYKKGKLMQSRTDSNMVLLLIGGMYYRPLRDVIARMEHAKFNVSVLSVQQLKGKEMYVIGAKENDLKSNQIWVEKTSLRIIRIIENLNKDNRMDMTFEAHKAMCKGFTETKVSFRRNGKLEQVEEYYDIKESTGFQK